MDAQPINNTENKMRLLFRLKGIKDEDIRFKGLENRRYIQYQYWKWLIPDVLEYIQTYANINLVSENWDDEDTGPCTAYIITKKL